MTLDELRELNDAATPGPWRASGMTVWRPEAPDDPTDFSGRAVAYAADATAPILDPDDQGPHPDAAFIVAAVEYVRAVLSQPETLDAAWKEAEARLVLACDRADVAGTLPEEVAAALAVVHGLVPSPGTRTAALIEQLDRLKEHTDG